MRPLPLLAASLLLLSSVGFAQSAPPAKPAAKAPAPAEKEEEIKIPGVVLDRPDGRFLGVETDGVTLKITFYNAKKKAEAADAIRITARWHDNKPRNTVLLPSSPETLVSPAVFKRPFNYIVYLVLVGADEQVKETYSLRLQ